MLLTKGGVVVDIFPFDHAAWTSALAAKERAISEDIQRMPGVKGKELWITGTFAPVAKGALENRGWKVQDKYQEQILTKLGH